MSDEKTVTRTEPYRCSLTTSEDDKWQRAVEVAIDLIHAEVIGGGHLHNEMHRLEGYAAVILSALEAKG